MIDPAAEQQIVNAVPKQLFIDGVWVDASEGATFPVVDPSTGEVLCSAADASPEDGMKALEAASRAQAAFAAIPPRQRADILMSAFQLLHERVDDLALLITLEMGKPLAESRGEVAYAAEFFRHFAEEAVRINGGYQVAPAGGTRFLVARQPVGPCLLITPWNFPMAMGTCEIGPAIAAGCTVVVKPSSQTPLSMLALVDILREAGVPDGVVNIVTTTQPRSVMEPQIRSGLARKLSFTGSVAVGRRLLEQCAPKVLRTSMELGGNAAFIVFPDADLDAAVEGALRAKTRNSGQSCTAANRFYVHADVVDQFGKRLAQRMDELPMGRGVDAGTRVGPLIHQVARDNVQSLVDDALSLGAELLIGGKATNGEGCFYLPTVLTHVPHSARMRHEDIFGPVAAISSFTTEDEVVVAANNTEYGLVNYLYTNDIKRALRMADALECGMVGLNQSAVANPAAPFGGVKASGLGREGGQVGINEFLETKYIGIAIN